LREQKTVSQSGEKKKVRRVEDVEGREVETKIKYAPKGRQESCADIGNSLRFWTGEKVKGRGAEGRSPARKLVEEKTSLLSQ